MWSVTSKTSDEYSDELLLPVASDTSTNVSDVFADSPKAPKPSNSASAVIGENVVMHQIKSSEIVYTSTSQTFRITPPGPGYSGV